LLINWKRGGLGGVAAAREVPVPAHAPQVPGGLAPPVGRQVSVPPAHAPPVHGLAQAAAAVAEVALWVLESRMFSGEARPARPPADPLQAPGQDRHLRHRRATRDRAGPQVEVPLQGRRVLGQVPALVSEAKRPQGQPRLTLGVATPPRPIGAPQLPAQPWEDQEQPILELAADLPLEEVVLSNPDRLEAVRLHLVEEVLSNPDQATVVQARWVPGWLVLGLEVLQELELAALLAPLDQGALVVLAVPVLEVLLAPLDQGVLVVLAVPVLDPDLEVQALDLAPAQALALPALSETGCQGLPPPLLGAGAFWELVWQEGFWEELQEAQEVDWQAGSRMLSNLTGMVQTSTSHSQSRRKALEAICLAAARSRMVIRPQATGQAGAPTLLGALANGSRRSRGCRRKCLDLVLEPDSWAGPLLGWPVPWPATASTTSTRSSRGRCT